MNYGMVLEELREAAELKRKDIAKILNISNSLYSRYEKEIQIMPIEHLNTLANYYKVSLDYLFNLTKTNNYSKVNNINIKLASERLKAFRKEFNLTQSKLATLLNTSHSVISEYEHGKKLISTPFIYTIAKKYHLSIDYLLGKTDASKELVTN